MKCYPSFTKGYSYQYFLSEVLSTSILFIQSISTLYKMLFKFIFLSEMFFVFLVLLQVLHMYIYVSEKLYSSIVLSDVLFMLYQMLSTLSLDLYKSIFVSEIISTSIFFIHSIIHTLPNVTHCSMFLFKALSTTLFFVPSVIHPNKFPLNFILAIPNVIQANIFYSGCYLWHYFLSQVFSRPYAHTIYREFCLCLHLLFRLLSIPTYVYYPYQYYQWFYSSSRVLKCYPRQYILFIVFHQANISYHRVIQGYIYFDISYPNSFLLASVLSKVLSNCIFNVKIYLTKLLQSLGLSKPTILSHYTFYYSY